MRYVLRHERVWNPRRSDSPDLEFDLPDNAQIVGIEPNGGYLLVNYVIPAPESAGKG